jgi:hypothetical protein
MIELNIGFVIIKQGKSSHPETNIISGEVLGYRKEFIQ